MEKLIIDIVMHNIFLSNFLMSLRLVIVFFFTKVTNMIKIPNKQLKEGQVYFDLWWKG